MKVSGVKDLVLDAELMKPLDRIAGASLLKVQSLCLSLPSFTGVIDVNASDILSRFIYNLYRVMQLW